MDRGKYIKDKLKYFGGMHNSYLILKEKGDEEKLKALTERMDQEKAKLHTYLEGLPRTYSKSYSESDYKADKQNVLDYYTRWAREDVFETRASLSRLRKYERREGLEPFDVILAREKLHKELERLSRSA
jgi:hypothetical protein